MPTNPTAQKLERNLRTPEQMLQGCSLTCGSTRFIIFSKPYCTVRKRTWQDLEMLARDAEKKKRKSPVPVPVRVRLLPPGRRVPHGNAVASNLAVSRKLGREFLSSSSFSSSFAPTEYSGLMLRTVAWQHGIQQTATKLILIYQLAVVAASEVPVECVLCILQGLPFCDDHFRVLPQARLSFCD